MVWLFFKGEFQKVTGVDISETEFDRLKGFTILQKQPCCLVLTLENLTNCWENAISDFLSIKSPPKLMNQNVRTLTALGAVYKRCKDKICLGIQALKGVYESPLVRHFYSDEDIKRFYDQ